MTNLNAPTGPLADYAALYATAIAAALAFGRHGPIYWDSFRYIAQAESGEIGGLGLGRPAFVIASHALARIVAATGASVFSLEPALRMFWLAVAACSAPLTAALARECGLSRSGGIFAGLAVALSPAFAQASAAVLTDGPSVSVTLLALLLAARAVRERDRPSVALGFAAGAALGLAFGLRESSLFNAPALALIAWLPVAGSRGRLTLAMLSGLILAGAAPVLYALAVQPNYLTYVRTYFYEMARERVAHAYGATDFLAYCGWLLALGPVVLVLAVLAWTRSFGAWVWQLTIARAICVLSLLQLVILAGYQDISYSPRYLIGALPGALAIPAASVLAPFANSRRRLWLSLAALALPLLVLAPIARWFEAPTRAAIDALPALLARVPSGSVVVTGQPCPAVDLYDRLQRAANRQTATSWQPLCPGWGWPADLTERLDRAQQEGRTVVIDLRPGAWVGRQQHAARDEVSQYVATHPAAEPGRRLVVWR